METETLQKKEFDVLLGGSQKLPEYINVMRFAEARAREVKGMLNALSEMNGTKLIFQQLPKHMRRRTMCHKIKRLPHKLREAHLNQLQKSGLPVKTKRPSRKWRRKPTNLLLEYNRRNKKHAWLETHIWHAKRFHMVEKWGFKLPLRSCDKTFRACYRATAKYCLLQDISYYGCIEVSGEQNVLIEGFKSVTNANTGLTIAAKIYLNSQREGTAMFYKKDRYPFGAIGEVQFIWKPSADNNRVLWLWAHPTYYNELLENLIQVFELTRKQNTEDGKTYLNLENDISVKTLKNNFNRFRLTGPLSNAVLQNSLKVPLPNNKTPWFDEYLNSNDNRQIFYDQSNFWTTLKDIKTPAELSPHIIVNLITTDPRYNFPNKRSKACPTNKDTNEVPEICPSLKYGVLWECSTTKLVSKSKMSTAQYLKDRANLLVPEDEVPDTACAIPVMLIQRPGVKNNSRLLGYGSGWDIILPSEWGLPFWLCLVMWGAKVGGLRESESIQYEMGYCDILPPDTKAGKREDEYISNKYREKYFKLPPAKRTNFNTFDIRSPFKCAWKKIIEDWKADCKRIEDYYVLRDRKILNNLQQILTSKHQKKFELLDHINLKLNENCLVPIRLNLLKKGRALKYALICLPDECDLGKKSTLPVEKCYVDINQDQRKKLRKDHQLILKRLRRKRVRAKKDGKILLKSVDIIKQQDRIMQDLWLPEPVNIKNSGMRYVIGFITKGDISFISGKGQSVGYIPVGALGTLFRNSQADKVLVRNTHSRQYRLAKIEIICP